MRKLEIEWLCKNKADFDDIRSRLKRAEFSISAISSDLKNIRNRLNCSSHISINGKDLAVIGDIKDVIVRNAELILLILDYLNVEEKTTPEETKLVERGK